MFQVSGHSRTLAPPEDRGGAAQKPVWKLLGAKRGNARSGATPARALTRGARTGASRARFANPGGFLQAGANIYLQSGSTGEPIEAVPGQNGLGTLLPGQLELSTTEAVTELVELIKTQRVFQMNSQTIQTADEALQTIANLRR